jgi:hypothetical protein
MGTDGGRTDDESTDYGTTKAKQGMANWERSGIKTGHFLTANPKNSKKSEQKQTKATKGKEGSTEEAVGRTTQAECARPRAQRHEKAKRPWKT